MDGVGVMPDERGEQFSVQGLVCGDGYLTTKRFFEENVFYCSGFRQASSFATFGPLFRSLPSTATEAP